MRECKLADLQHILPKNHAGSVRTSDCHRDQHSATNLTRPKTRITAWNRCTLKVLHGDHCPPELSSTQLRLLRAWRYHRAQPRRRPIHQRPIRFTHKCGDFCSKCTLVIRNPGAQGIAAQGENMITGEAVKYAMLDALRQADRRVVVPHVGVVLDKAERGRRGKMSAEHVLLDWSPRAISVSEETQRQSLRA